MNKRMIMNDLRSNRMVSAATFIFMAVTAMLLGLSIFLFASLSDSIDKLMTEAETPDFLQMHTGELDEEQLISFSQQREISKCCRFRQLHSCRAFVAQNNKMCLIENRDDTLIVTKSRRRDTHSNPRKMASASLCSSVLPS